MSEIQTRREAFYGRADQESLAPLWTRLKSLVPEAPVPACVAHQWRYEDVRPTCSNPPSTSRRRKPSAAC